MPQYQEKNKIKLPKSGYSWYYRCYYTDMYGNRKQKQSKMYPNKKAAKEAEMEFLSKIRTTDEVNYNISFREAYNEWWEVKKSLLKPTTTYNTKLNLDKNILKWFKDYKLNSIKLNTLLNWKKQLLKTNLSLNYKNCMIGYLKEMLMFSADNYDFDMKIVTRLQKEKDCAPKRIKSDAETNYWTLEEFKKFINHVDKDLDKLMYIFLYYTGLRLGEMIALTWDDLCFDRKEIVITKTFTNKISDYEWKIISPKTNNSVRKVDLNDNLIELLKKHKEKEQKLYGFNNDMFIFGNVKHISPTNFALHLNNWINIAKVKTITPHGFRHSHASLLIHLGCDSRDVADRLGDTVQVVESTYAHLFPKKRSETLEKLNNL